MPDKLRTNSAIRQINDGLTLIFKLKITSLKWNIFLIKQFIHSFHHWYKLWLKIDVIFGMCIWYKHFQSLNVTDMISSLVSLHGMIRIWKKNNKNS